MLASLEEKSTTEEDFEIEINFDAHSLSHAKSTEEMEINDDENMEDLAINKTPSFRATPFHLLTKEQQSYLENNMSGSEFKFNIIRKPNILLLDNDNEIQGEVPQLSGHAAGCLHMKDKKNNDCVLVKIANDEAVLFVKESKLADNNLRNSCAKIMTNSFDITRPNTKRSFKIAVKVEKKEIHSKAKEFYQDVVKFDNSNPKSKKALQDPTKNMRYESFNIHCKCNTPLEKKSNTKDMTTCNQCKEKFHKDCVNVAEKNFNCTSCSFKNKGLTWSEKPLSVYNTCPIDNTFTHLAMRCEKSPQFKEEIHRLEQNGSTDCVKGRHFKKYQKFFIV